LRVTSVVAHGPGTKLLHGLAEASTNGIAAYTYRRRAEFLKRETVETGPCANHASSLLLLVWPQDSWTYSFAKEGWLRLKKKMAPFLTRRRRGSCFKPPIIKLVRDK